MLGQAKTEFESWVIIMVAVATAQLCVCVWQQMLELFTESKQVKSKTERLPILLLLQLL